MVRVSRRAMHARVVLFVLFGISLFVRNGPNGPGVVTVALPSLQLQLNHLAACLRALSRSLDPSILCLVNAHLERGETYPFIQCSPAFT